MTTTSMSTASTRSAAIEQVQPYLFFNGRCDEALEFYRETLGAEVTMLLRYKDSPQPPSPDCPTPPADKVMHVGFRIGGSELCASDGMCDKPSFAGFSLSISTRSVPEAKRIFAALSQGGKVDMPIEQTFFSPAFGMLTDKFGIGWMVYTLPADQKN